TLEEAIMEVWGPVEHRRRSSASAGKALNDKLKALSLMSPKLTPATSSTLANGSLTPLDEQESLMSENADMKRRKPLYIREGGSIPAIRFLEKEFGAPAAHLPCGQASDSAHLDNERLRLVNLNKSKDIFKKVFKELPRK
ncbi:hypothetical protein LTS18_010176, partial [Coniosporium uncinatum]